MHLFYREIAPPAGLDALVLSFWEFTVEETAPEPVRHEIFPDGCVSLFYQRNERADFRRLALSGLNLTSVTVEVLPGDVYWGVRISPAAGASVLRAAPADLRHRPGVAAELFPHLTCGLLEELNACRSFAEAIEIYGARLQKAAAGAPDEKVARAAAIIETQRGEIKIADLAEALAISPRQLERRFKQSAGLSPKQYARARRLRATAIDWLENRALNWAGRAAEMGFTDQAHLAREFVSVTKRSPQSFAAKVDEIEHGSLVK